MLRAVALLPIDFCVGRISEALMLCHCSSKHIGVVFLVNNEVAVLILIEKTWSKLIEPETPTTLPINFF